MTEELNPNRDNDFESALLTIIRFSCNSVDPKDFGKIRQEARQCLHKYYGYELIDDKQALARIRRPR